ncbi:MAG: 50S ribosomal protein L37ae [Nitrososphaeria archaeon]|nr:50S ribosomal protein L37ae [Nitrososphaeria archaeon]
MPKKAVSNIAARFGARYGRKVRKRWNEVMSKRKALYVCPSCLKRSVLRISVGVWRCRKCGYTFAGGAYEPFVSRR